MILRGERVLLRSVEPKDRDRLAEILAEPEVARWWGAYDAARVQAELIDEDESERLAIDPAAHNERAIRAFERVGFRPVGLMRRYERGPEGTWHDGLLMDLLAAEFR